MTPNHSLSIPAVARAHPDRCALIDRGRRVTYGRLALSISRLALWFDRAGLRPGDTVGIALRDEFDHLVTSLALLRLGCAQLTVATAVPVPFSAETARRCGVSVTVAAPDAGGVLDVATILPDFEKIYASPPAAETALPDPDLEAPALVSPSSGTTGRPKIVRLSQRQLLSGCWTKDMGNEPQVVFRPVSIEFDAAKRQHLNAAIRGMTTVLCDPAGQRRPDIVCRDHRVRRLFLSPAQARSMVDVARESGEGGRLPGTQIHVGGAPVGGQLRRDMLRHQSDRVWITYGTTECGTISGGLCPVGETDTRKSDWDSDVGRLLPGVELEVVDEMDRPVPASATGRLRIRTAGMVSEYHDDPEATARAFRDGWFYSGDAGRIAPDGRLCFAGRADDMMCLSGVNIFPREIEQVIEAFVGVIECAAFPMRSSVHGDIPVAAVRTEAGVDLGELQRHCRSVLGIRAPRKLVRVDHLPRNGAGKMVRGDLAGLVRR